MMTLDESNRLRALKAKDDGIAFDLEVLKVADQLLDAAERLEQAERDHAAVLDSVKAAHDKELEGVLYWKHKAETALAALMAEREAQAEAVKSACRMAYRASYLGFDREWAAGQIAGIQNTIVREEMQAIARAATNAAGALIASEGGDGTPPEAMQCIKDCPTIASVMRMQAALAKAEERAKVLAAEVRAWRLNYTAMLAAAHKQDDGGIDTDTRERGRKTLIQCRETMSATDAAGALGGER